MKRIIVLFLAIIMLITCSTVSSAEFIALVETKKQECRFQIYHFDYNWWYGSGIFSGGSEKAVININNERVTDLGLLKIEINNEEGIIRVNNYTKSTDKSICGTIEVHKIEEIDYDAQVAIANASSRRNRSYHTYKCFEKTPSAYLSFIDNKLNGISIVHYDGLIYEFPFENDNVNGLLRVYKNNKIFQVINVDRGLFNGKAWKYNDKGLLVRETDYENSKINGDDVDFFYKSDTDEVDETAVTSYKNGVPLVFCNYNSHNVLLIKTIYDETGEPETIYRYNKDGKIVKVIDAKAKRIAAEEEAERKKEEAKPKTLEELIARLKKCKYLSGVVSLLGFPDVNFYPYSGRYGSASRWDLKAGSLVVVVGEPPFRNITLITLNGNVIKDTIGEYTRMKGSIHHFPR